MASFLDRLEQFGQPQNQQSRLLSPQVINNPQAGTMQSAARQNSSNYLSANGLNYFGGGPGGEITPGGGVVNAQMTPEQQQWYRTEYGKQPEARMIGPVTVRPGEAVRISGRPEMGGDGPTVRTDPNVVYDAPGTFNRGFNFGQINPNDPMSVADALKNLFGSGSGGMFQGSSGNTMEGGVSGSGGSRTASNFAGGSSGGGNNLQSMFGSILNAGGYNTGSANNSNTGYSLNQGYNTSGDYSYNKPPYAPTDTQSAYGIQLQQLQNDMRESYDPNGLQQLSSGQIDQMIRTNPMYKAQYESGLQALNRTQARGGYLASGRALSESADFGTQLAGNVYQSLLSNLGNLTAQTTPLQQQYGQQTATNAGVNYQAGVAPAQARSSAALAVGSLQGTKAIQDSINKTQASIATSQNMTNASIANSQNSASSMAGIGNIAGSVVGGLF